MLTSDMRAAGQDLTVSVQGDVSHLAPGIDLAAYRILQEALINALRHAPPPHVTARVSHVGQTLELEVIDDGNAISGPRSNGRVGLGLLGMRERAAIYGGTLEAGPRTDAAGVCVRAVLLVGEPQ